MDQAPPSKLLQRAWAAYLKIESAAADQPIEHCSGVQVLDGLKYVALRSEQRVLAAYRVKRSTGALRRMKRWPLELARDTQRPNTRNVDAQRAVMA